MAQTALAVADDEDNDRKCERISHTVSGFLVSPYRQARRQFGTAKNLGNLRVLVTTIIVGNTTYKTGSAAKMFDMVSELGVEGQPDMSAGERVWRPLFLEALRTYVKAGGTLNEWAHVIVTIQCMDGRQDHRFGAGTTDFDPPMFRS